MFFLKLVVFFLILRSSNAVLSSITNDENQEVSSFIARLAQDFNQKDSSTHDISVFHFFLSTSFIHKKFKLLQDITAAIPKENPLLMPRFNMDVVGKNIRVSSFIIVVIDFMHPVSTEQLNEANRFK